MLQNSTPQTFLASKILQNLLHSRFLIIDGPRDGEVADDDEIGAQIPVVDFSLLISGDSELHAKGVKDLSRACEEWGFFLLINHGVPESLIEKVIRMTHQFHNMSSEEKTEFADNDISSSIRWGTSVNPKVESVHYWRDYLKVKTHPDFTFPHKPAGFKEVAKEYCEKIKGVVRNLLGGASESLGLESNAIAKTTGFENGLQHYIANLYPPCPQPELAMVLPAHSDHGLFTILIHNGINGLQVNHDGKWVNIYTIPKSLFVNVADQLEVVTNGRYKSVLHRAALSNKATRISTALIHAPEFDKVISPAQELLENEEPVYKGMTYAEYYFLHQTTILEGKSKLASIRIKPQQ